MTTKIKILFIALVLFIMLSGGGLQKSHAQTVDATIVTGYDIVTIHDYDTMECYNYAMVSDKMFELQSKRIYSRGWLRLVYENKINALRPSVINWEIQCLGYGVTPN